LSFKTQLNL